MSETNKPKKPLCIRRAEAYAELAAAVNHISEKYGLSFSVLDDILFRIQTEVARGAQNELAAAKANYNALVAELEKNEKEEMSENG